MAAKSNACQTALALAEFEAQGENHEAVIDPNAFGSLKVKHFETVANSPSYCENTTQNSRRIRCSVRTLEPGILLTHSLKTQE
ncbi:hypothetical protein CHU98_g7816 [Xylaria longipes]|nr:hypothetical protein CHU98_g7816 [Xylaria longipes]